MRIESWDIVRSYGYENPVQNMPKTLRFNPYSFCMGIALIALIAVIIVFLSKKEKYHDLKTDRFYVKSRI